MLWKIFLSRHTLRTHQTTCAGQPYLALDGASGKEPAHQCRLDIRDTGSIPGLGRSPREGNGSPLQYSCLENPRGQRSLASCSPQAHIESNKTEATQHGSTHKVQPHFWFGNTSGAISDRCQILRSQTRKQQLNLKEKGCMTFSPASVKFSLPLSTSHDSDTNLFPASAKFSGMPSAGSRASGVFQRIPLWSPETVGEEAFFFSTLYTECLVETPLSLGQLVNE